MFKADKTERQRILNISMFMVSCDHLRTAIWSIKSAKIDPVRNTLSIGIGAQKGKYGTTLELMRKNAKNLGEYLYENKITKRVCKVSFFIQKEDLELENIHNIIERIEQNLMNKAE